MCARAPRASGATRTQTAMAGCKLGCARLSGSVIVKRRRKNEKKMDFGGGVKLEFVLFGGGLLEGKLGQHK